MTEDSIPPRSRTPAYGSPSGPLLELAEDVSRLTIQVDRLRQAGKIIKWVAMTAAVFALGSSLAVARMLYGWGRDDEALRSDLRQVQTTLTEVRTDLKELRNLTYRQLFKIPSGMDLPANASSPKDDSK